jgi:TusA-related sulfurtransferase
MKKKITKVKEATLKIKFANKKAAMGFASWLCEMGEQEYWEYQKYREEEEEGDITAVIFDYHGPKNNGKFMRDNIIRTTVGRLDSPEDTPDIED